MPSSVLSAMRTHIELESRIGGYEAALENSTALTNTYKALAELVNGHPDEIALLDSATRAWHAVFHAIDWQHGDVILTARSEYNANIVSFLHAEKTYGITFKFVPDREDGTIDLDALDAMIDARTKLICLSHMPTNDGLVHPAAQVGAVARAHGIPFLLDACQSAGQMPLDVDAIGCTMLSATGRKYLRGPRGTGFLWVRSDWIARLEPRALDIRSATWPSPGSYEIASDARRFELWEGNIAGQIALGAAARYALDADIAVMWPRIAELARSLRRAIGDLTDFTVHDRGFVKSGIVTFSHKTVPAAEIVARLRSFHAINTSVSASQLTRADLVEWGTTHMVRASVHAYNTNEELDALITALDAIARQWDTSVPQAKNKNKASRQPSMGVEL